VKEAGNFGLNFDVSKGAMGGPPTMLYNHTDSAANAASMTWPAWLLEEERLRGRLLLALLLPISVLFALLDLRLTGSQLWINLGLRGLAVALVAGAFWALWRSNDPGLVFGLLGAGALAFAAFFLVRYGQGLGVGGVPGHLPSDLVMILILFVVPNVLPVQALAAACIAIASAIDYLVWKQVGGPEATILITTLLLTWCLGLGMAISRRLELRQRYAALKEVYLLRSSIPICAWCKSIRDDAGIWERLETYLEKNADMMLTHGVCPSCLEKVEAEDSHV